MKIQGDERLWFDKVRKHNVYGLYPDQRFYSVEYVEQDPEVRAFMGKLEIWNAWCQDSYARLQQGVAPLPFPKELKEVKRNAKAKTTKAQPDAEGRG